MINFLNVIFDEIAEYGLTEIFTTEQNRLIQKNKIVSQNMKFLQVKYKKNTNIIECIYFNDCHKFWSHSIDCKLYIIESNFSIETLQTIFIQCFKNLNKFICVECFHNDLDNPINYEIFIMDSNPNDDNASIILYDDITNSMQLTDIFNKYFILENDYDSLYTYLHFAKPSTKSVGLIVFELE